MIGEVDSEDSAATTYVSDGKMGRAKTSKGIYAMGAPRTDMSRFFSQCDDTEEIETDCGSIESMEVVSMWCVLYVKNEKF